MVSDFTYTLETIIQAGKRDLVIASIPIETNRPIRPSRLFRSVPEYLRRSGATILRIYAMYEPLRVFVTLGALLALCGAALGLRFMWYFLTRPGPTGHVQSLILGAVLFVVGFQVALIGVAADLIAMNRRLLEETLYRVKRLEVETASVNARPSGTDSPSAIVAGNVYDKYAAHNPVARRLVAGFLRTLDRLVWRRGLAGRARSGGGRRAPDRAPACALVARWAHCLL